MRSGMAMIMALGFMIIIAGILATMINLTSVTTNRTEHMYFQEQAQLLAKSATEFALLSISGHDRTALDNDCVTNTTSLFPPAGNAFFTVNTTIRYIGLNCGAANTFIATPFAGTGNNIATESDGTVLIDVYVNTINAQLNLTEVIAYHRRTLQKP